MRGDRVRITAELGVTTECYRLQPRCRRSPYRYDPRVRTQLVLAPSPKAKGKRRTMAISKRRHETCTRSGARNTSTTASSSSATQAFMCVHRSACRASSSAAMSISSQTFTIRARVGERDPRGRRPATIGKIKGDRGRINAIRYRDTLPSDFRRTGTRQLRRRTVPPDLERAALISKRLRGLRAGEQLAVTAGFREDVSSLPYAVRTSVYLILAESPRRTASGRLRQGARVRLR